MRTLLPFFALIALSGSVLADPDSGRELLSQCQLAERFSDTGALRDPVKVMTCVSFIEGVHNTMQFMSVFIEKRNSIKSCIPDEITNEQAIRIVLKFLRSRPCKIYPAAAGTNVEHRVTLAEPERGSL